MRAASADLPTTVSEAARVLTLPAWVLTRVAGGNVRKLRPDRLMELTGPDLRIGVYPSDIAISGTARDRTRARAAILSRLATTSAHLTTSAEAQAVEDRLEEVATKGRTAGATAGRGMRDAFRAVDTLLLDLQIPTDEWDILYRLRLQLERDILAGAEPGTMFPGRATAAHPPVKPAVSSDRARGTTPVRPVASGVGGRS